MDNVRSSGHLPAPPALWFNRTSFGGYLLASDGNVLMKILSRAWLSVKILSVILFLAWGVFAQDCEHRGNVDRIEHVRVLPPDETKITVYDGKKLEYVIQDRWITKIGALEINNRTLLPTGFEKSYRDKRYWIIFCVQHFVVYRIDVYDPKRPK